ncbi:pterin 4 alpha carbinolamine dehydratase-domain-containing protein [Scenedesmus sp. NREL 46B-D3]|nr:pterin 4 alpha carbinolamine dehydratase-domain-containing protein [Scenedesmus sp. NREL 46B-D3]
MHVCCASSQDNSQVSERSSATRFRMLMPVQVDARWQIVEDSEKRLRLRRVMRTKNFTKALELFQRVGQVAEAEGHHPDLHLEGWNNVSIELWTHARNGLSENDFIVAAKFDDIDLADLLSKRQPEL